MHSVENRSSAAKDYVRLNTVKATMEDGRAVSVSGTVFEPNRPRIVAINDLHFEMKPEGSIILLDNKDVPGVIGSVGTLLGEAGVNIGEISWGRDQQGGTAMTATNIDGDVSQEIVDRLAQLPNVLSARLIKL